MAIKKERGEELLKDADPKAVFSFEGLLSETEKALANGVRASTSWPARRLADAYRDREICIRPHALDRLAP